VHKKAPFVVHSSLDRCWRHDIISLQTSIVDASNWACPSIDAATVAAVAAAAESDTRRRTADRSHQRKPGRESSRPTVVDYLVTGSTRRRRNQCVAGSDGRLISASRPANLLWLTRSDVRRSRMRRDCIASSSARSAVTYYLAPYEYRRFSVDNTARI